MWIILGAVVLTLLLYSYVWKPQRYWKNKGVPFIRPVPIVGNFIWPSLQRRSFADEHVSQYRSHPDTKILGTFIFNRPSLMIRDPELIKTLAIKEFDHFFDHSDVFFQEDVDSLLAKNLFALKGKRWRNMRSTLSPSFTGSKMRGMFKFMNECGAQFAKFYLAAHKNQATEQTLEVELKDLYTRFTNDVIASTAFGIKIDSFEDPTNVFYRMGKLASNFKVWRLLVVILLPCATKIFRIGVISPIVGDFFRKLVKETMDTRERENIIRPDMIHLLMESRKGRLSHEDSSYEKEKSFAVVEESHIGKSNEKIELTDEDITSQAFIFFVAGFDTASVLMCFASYEMVVNPDIQKRLQEEIDYTLGDCNGKLTYEALMKMDYLDNVISETLRKWPPAITTDRNCTKPYTLKVDDKEMHIEPGENVNFPIIGIHRDPQYYPNPDKFDPDRFNEENKGSIIPFTYLPFGLGPRNCIGSRFALLEAKLAIFYLVANFDIVPSPKTHIPVVLSCASPNMNAKHGFWFGLQPRNI